MCGGLLHLTVINEAINECYKLPQVSIDAVYFI